MRSKSTCSLIRRLPEWQTANLVIIKGLLSGHFLNGLVQNETDGFAGFAVVERKCLFSGHVEQQISFTDAAAHDHLNGITAASIIFGNTNDLFIFGQTACISSAAQFQFQQINGIQCGTVADGQSGTNMAVKRSRLFPNAFLSMCSSPYLIIANIMFYSHTVNLAYTIFQ